MVDAEDAAQRAHAQIVHGRDTEAHGERSQRAMHRAGRHASGEEHRNADHQHAQKKGEQCRQHRIADRNRQLGGEHAHEMHGPDAERERYRSGGEQQPTAKTGRIAERIGEREAEIASKRGQKDGKQNEPWIVAHASPLVSSGDAVATKSPPGSLGHARSGVPDRSNARLKRASASPAQPSRARLHGRGLLRSPAKAIGRAVGARGLRRGGARWRRRAKSSSPVR